MVFVLELYLVLDFDKEKLEKNGYKCAGKKKKHYEMAFAYK